MPFKMMFSGFRDCSGKMEQAFEMYNSDDNNTPSDTQTISWTSQTCVNTNISPSSNIKERAGHNPENPDLKEEPIADILCKHIPVENSVHRIFVLKGQGDFHPISFGRDIFAEIFSHLSFQQLLRVQRVCKFFYAILSPTTGKEELFSDLIWQRVFERDYTIPPGDLELLKSHTDKFSYRDLVRNTPKWCIETNHEEIELDSKCLIAGKRCANSNIGVAQSRIPYERGRHVIQILVNDGGDSCVLGFTEMRFEPDANRRGNMKCCVGNYRCKNWGVTGWGTFWTEGEYESISNRKFTTGDRITMVLDLDANQLTYYKNNIYHGRFDNVRGKLYLTVTMRQSNRVTLIPTIPSIALSHLIDTNPDDDNT